MPAVVADEGVSGPTLGELSRRIDDLSRRVSQLLDMAVGARLNEIDRRLDSIERIMTTGANQRSSATWQALFLVLGMIASMVGGIALSSVLR
jgi:tetrahydromethanopterin S-methyltransferase subunit G